MEQVQFEEENINFNYNMQQKKQGFSFPGFLLKKGIAKNEKQANVILLVLAILFLFISMLLIKKSVGGIKQSSVNLEISKEVFDRLPTKVQEVIKNTRK